MNAYLLSKNDSRVADQWDFGLIKDLLEGKLWQPGLPNFQFYQCDKLVNDETAVVVLPARHHAGEEEWLNKELKKINKVILFLIGDEEAEFDVKKITHELIHIWVQNPHPGIHDDYHKLGTGYPPHMEVPYEGKDTDVFFSGQITHERRREMLGNLKEYGADVIETDGFTQGLEPKEYYRRMSKAKLAPAPSGAVLPDSFRLFEALECMAIPLADSRNSQRTISGYWTFLFDDDPPFPQIDEWDELVGLCERILKDMYPRLMHQQTAWWMHKKREMAYRLLEQING